MTRAAMVPEMDEKVLSLVDEYADGEQPFFIYYPTLAVHGPLMPAPQFRGKSGLNAYADFVLQVDDFVGRLTAKLEEKGIADDTILIFTSDNGCSPVANFPQLIAGGHNPSYLYRGWKADIWEGGHRIPFLIRWPGHIPAGTACGQMACLTRPVRHLRPDHRGPVWRRGGRGLGVPAAPAAGGGPPRPGHPGPPQRRRLLLHPQGAVEAGAVPGFRRDASPLHRWAACPPISSIGWTATWASNTICMRASLRSPRH